MLSAAIESPQWKIKAEAARAMGTVALKLGDAIPVKEQKHLLTILLNGLAGRTWNGKEAILIALSSVCKSGAPSVRELLKGEAMEADSGKIDEEALVQCLFKECKKEKLDYKIVAIESTGIIFSHGAVIQ